MKKNTIDFDKLKRYSVKTRLSKVQTKDFVKIDSKKNTSFATFFESMPHFLKASDLSELVDVAAKVIKKKKTFVLAMGAHVIKVGLSPIVIDLINRGYVSHIVFNGAGMIHDFEIAYGGTTSENVDKAIKDGSFGMAIETGKLINEAIQDPQKGLGYNLGKYISENNLKNKKYSIMAAAFEKKIPLTVHVAIGTDIIHYHPEFDPCITGIATHQDFKIFIETVTRLEGGLFLNFGSAVIIPEVFLKAITVARNLGFKINKLTTANFDFVQQYRPTVNIVSRPTSEGGKGYSFTGHHEIMMPLIYYAIKTKLGS